MLDLWKGTHVMTRALKRGSGGERECLRKMWCGRLVKERQGGCLWRWRRGTVSQAASRSWKRPGNGFSSRASRRNAALPRPRFPSRETGVGLQAPEQGDHPCELFKPLSCTRCGQSLLSSRRWHRGVAVMAIDGGWWGVAKLLVGRTPPTEVRQTKSGSGNGAFQRASRQIREWWLSGEGLWVLSKPVHPLPFPRLEGCWSSQPLKLRGCWPSRAGGRVMP